MAFLKKQVVKAGTSSISPELLGSVKSICIQLTNGGIRNSYTLLASVFLDSFMAASFAKNLQGEAEEGFGHLN